MRSALMNCLTFLFLFIPFLGNSQKLGLHSSSDSYSVTYFAGIYSDQSGRLSFSEIRGKEFERSGKTGFLFPFSNGATWLKVVVTNENSLKTNWVLEWENAMVEELDFFISQPNGTYRTKKTGLGIFKKPKLLSGIKPALAFDLALHESKVIYIKVKGQRAHYASANLFSADAYHDHELNQLNIFAFLSGAIAIRLVYVLLMALFAVKDSDFRRYSVLLIARSFAFWGLYGMLGYLFVDPTVSLTVSFFSFHFLPSVLVFTLKVVFPQRDFPLLLRRVLQVIVWVNILLAVGVLFSYRWELILASTYLIIGTQLLILVLYAVAMVKRYPINWNYSLAYLIGLGGYIFIQMRLVGWVDFIWASPIALVFFVLEFLVFGYFLGRIVQDYERRRVLAFQELTYSKEQTLRIQELDRLKTRFFTNISHEFKTPLSLLTAPLEEIRQKYPKEGLIPIMQRNVKRLQLLITQLLDLSKLEAGEFKTELRRGDIVQFFSNIFSSFESLAQKQNIFFDFSQSHLTYEADFDSDNLEKIVSNLLSNAFKFTAPGGRVGAKIVYSDKELVVSIEDTGIGIDPTRLHRIFDRFYQADDSSLRSYEGTGIGLALTKELIDLLKGGISVKSEVGKGTSFKVTLPLIKHHSAELGRSSHPVAEEPVMSTTSLQELPQSKSIQKEGQPVLLIVEDSTDLRTYLRSVFASEYQIFEAENGLQGVDLAFEIIPDMVVTDLMMPQMDGLTLCQRLKSDERTSHIPVVLLTAKSTLSDRLEGLEIGADDYLQKPFSKEELRQRVNNLVHQRSLLRQKFSMLALDEAPAETQPEGLDNQFLWKARKVVDQHLANSRFTADDFSELMQMSRSNLHRKLKALTDQTTTEFVRNIRLHRAVDLLKQNNLTVSEVAYLVGFESLSYFSKTFQEYHGIAPSAVNGKIDK